MMAFTGFSSDKEGSIVYDGKKFIVTNPSKVPENFNPGNKPVVGLPETHPAHPNNRKPTTYVPPGSNPVFNKEKAREHVERARQARESARNKESKPGKPDVAEDSPADREPDIVLPDFLPDANGEEPAAEDDWPVNTPLSPGQQMHVDHLLSVETDILAREVLITLKRDGLPPKSQWNDFMAQYALWSWDAESDAIAWATLAKIAQSDWDKKLALSDSPLVEGVAQDQANDWVEGLVIINAKTGDTVLTKTGVVRGDGSQYVGLQDTEAEALQGLELIFVHNHTKEVGASDEDLESAFDAGAEVLIVITPSGREQVYLRGRGRMVLVRDEEASYEVGPGTLDEALYLLAESQAQARAFQADSPEFVFLQSDPEVIANMDVNPDEIERYEELKDFVTKGLDELQETGETELLAKIVESMALLEDVFGYNVEFCGGNSCDEEFNIEALSIAERQLAMQQVHNLATILFHFLNDLGIEIMQSTPEKTRYILWADERIRKLHNVEDFANRGHVFLPASLGEEDISELHKVYLGSEIKRGTIAHEVGHELDRRFEMDFSKYANPPEPGSLEWFMKEQVFGELNFTEMERRLTENSRASDVDNDNSEIFPDVLAAKVLAPLDEDFYSTAFKSAQPVGFNEEEFPSNVKAIKCGFEQYFDQLREYRQDKSKRPPEDFIYRPELCE